MTARFLVTRCAATRCAAGVDHCVEGDHCVAADRCGVVDHFVVADHDAEAARVVIREAPNAVPNAALIEAQSVVRFVAQVAARVVIQVVVVVPALPQVVHCAVPDYFAAARFRYPADRAIASRHPRAWSVEPFVRDDPRFEAGPLVDPLAGHCVCDRLVDPDE